MSNQASLELGGGAVGAYFLLGAGHPFDTVKTRLQNQPELYKNWRTCCKLTNQEGGIKTFYRGVGAIAPGAAVVCALSMIGFRHGENRVKKWCGDKFATTFGGYALAGFQSALYTTPLMGPGERIKVMAQTSKDGSWSVFKQLLKAKRGQGLFKGTPLTFARDGFGYALYFGVYEFCKQTHMKKYKVDTIPKMYNILYGGLCGCAMWAIVFPVDALKTRVQATTGDAKTMEIFRNMVQDKGGIKKMFVGVEVAMVRAFVANGAFWLGYELFMGAAKKYI